MKRELTWFDARSQYKKKRNGQVYYMQAGKGKDTAENYKLALQEWEERLADILKAEKKARQFTVTGPGPNDWRISDERQDENTMRDLNRGSPEAQALRVWAPDLLMGALRSPPRRRPQDYLCEARRRMPFPQRR